MVDGQVHPLQVTPGVLREQPPGGDIHRYHGVRAPALRGGQPLQIGGEEAGGLRVFQHPGRLSPPPQGQTQPRCAADGISVRPDVGEDQKIVPFHQPLRCLSLIHIQVSFALRASVYSLGPSTLRSSSRMWAPLSMESSSWNTSSGV